MITIFTPTFNRAHLLNRLYQSLLNQTNKEFEWVVVDDGSTDETEALFDKIRAEDNPFDIIYIKQSNGGKHRAINRGVNIARGELFFIVDSDDYLLPQAIEKLIMWKSALPSDKKWAGVSGLRGRSAENHIGGNGKGADYLDAKNTERDKYDLGGDKAEAYFTEVLRKYPFPEFDGENFITEETVWNAIAIDGYYLRWFNEVIYICEYLEGGLTKSGNSIFVKNPQGVAYWARVQLKAYRHNFIKKLKAVHFYYLITKAVKTKKEIASDLGITRAFVNLSIFAYNIKGVFRGKK